MVLHSEMDVSVDGRRMAVDGPGWCQIHSFGENVLSKTMISDIVIDPDRPKANRINESI